MNVNYNEKRKDYSTQWRLNRKQDGWKHICFFVPAEMVQRLKQFKRDFKLSNPHLYKKI